MIWRELLAARKGGLDNIEQHVLDMLTVDRETFDLSASGLLGAGDPDALRQQVSDSDHRVNLFVQQVRRELVVHASLHGVQTEIGAMFATMSIVKDIERVGDYAKRLLRVARVHGPIPSGTPEHAQLSAWCDRIADYLTGVRDALAERDRDKATALIVELRAAGDEVEATITELLTATPPPAEGVAVALTCHFLARIVAHLANVLTSIVAPVDMLDFYDEQDDAGTQPRA